MLKGAIFDMDGVLVDNMMVHVEAFASLARRYGVEVDLDTVLGMGGRGASELFETLFPREVVERVGVETLSREKEALYREMYAPRLTPARGLVAFLEGLKSHGVRLAVGTSAPTANLYFTLDGLGIRHLFDALVDVDMVTRAKPDPEIYLRALSELGLPAGECLVFEDAIAGIQAARAAEIKVVALSTSVPAPTLERTPGVALTVGDFTGIDFAALNAFLCD